MKYRVLVSQNVCVFFFILWFRDQEDSERIGSAVSTWNAVQILQQERDKIFEKLKKYEASISQTNDGRQARWLLDKYYELSDRCDDYHRQLMEISRVRFRFVARVKVLDW